MARPTAGHPAGPQGTASGEAPQLTLLNLFPTPLVIATLPDAERLNPELKRIILAREAVSESVQRSNHGGWQSSWDLHEWGGAPMQRVLGFARAIVEQVTVDREGKRHPLAWRINSWANVNRHGHGNQFHTHPGRALVGELLRRRRRHRRRPLARRRVRDPGPARRSAGHVRAVSDVSRPGGRRARRGAATSAARRHARGLPRAGSRTASARIAARASASRSPSTSAWPAGSGLPTCPINLFFSVPAPRGGHRPRPCATPSTRRCSPIFNRSARSATSSLRPRSPWRRLSTSSRPRSCVDAKLDELEQFVIGQAKTFLETVLRLPPRQLEIERSWINVFEPGAQEAQHSHDGSLLSCSYYVEAPKDCGCIVIPDPIGARRTHREFTKTAGNDVLTRREIAVEPQPGRLVMFESWTPHYVQCNKSDRDQDLDRDEPARSLAAGRGRPAGATERRRAVARGGDADQDAASAAAAQRGHADAKPFLFDEIFEARTDLKLSLKPIQNAIPTIMIDDFLKHPEEARERRRTRAGTELEAREGRAEFRRLLRLPATFSDPLSEQHDRRRASRHSPGLRGQHAAAGRERRRQLVHADPRQARRFRRSSQRHHGEGRVGRSPASFT